MAYQSLMFLFIVLLTDKSIGLKYFLQNLLANKLALLSYFGLLFKTYRVFS